jgi:hypothetical protein
MAALGGAGGFHLHIVNAGIFALKVNVQGECSRIYI